MARRVLARPIVERTRDLSARVSFAWLLPIAAVALALGVLWKSYSERGPLVEIRFETAGGVVAGETPVRRNDVEVGQVEAVRLADDLNAVIVEARLDPYVAPYIDEDARFWIVNARVNTTGISGLDTLLSGAYVEVDWNATADARRDEFVGLEEPPLTKRGTPGLRLTLNADEAGYIYVGSPVFHRQIEVGRVERRTLSADARQVLFDIFVESPYHRHIYPETRFYGVSGVEASVDADGATVRVESLSALITGGVAFENAVGVESGEPVRSDGSRFRLHDSRSAARESLFDDEEDTRYRFSAVFEGSVKGLRVGAPVEYNGLLVGRVASVSTTLPREPGARGRSTAVLQLQPRRLGIDEDLAPEAFRERLAGFVEEGLRVQLASGNLLTGSLIVKLVERPDAAAAAIDADAEPYPELPSVPSNIETLTADAETLISKLAALPLDTLLASATALLEDTRRLIASPDVAVLPARLAASLDSIATTAERVEAASEDLPAMIRALTSASRNADAVLEGISPDSEIYIELSATARELRIAARSIAAFAELLEENPSAVFTGR